MSSTRRIVRKPTQTSRVYGTDSGDRGDVERQPLTGEREREEEGSGDLTPQVLLFFLFPAIGGMLFGYDIGATSGALLSMTSASLSGTDWYALSTTATGLVVSLSLAGALGGSGLALLYGDKLGRRKELMLGGLLYFVGAGMVSQAPGGSDAGLLVVQLGRLLYGFGIGFSMHAAPAYIAETSPPSVRGLLISTKEAFIVGGILLGYLVSYLEISTVGGWRTIYGAAVPLALTLIGGMTFLPESPRWLALKGRKSDAAESLERISPDKSSDRLQEEIEQMMAMNDEAGSLPFWTVLVEPKYRRPLAVGLSLMLFQQITGQPSVLYYAAKIFQDAGFDSADSATAISVVLGLFKLVMTGVAIATVDSWGRRPLLLVGVSGIVVALLVLGGIQGDLIPFVSSSSDVGIWANVVALLLYVGAYQVSFGPISWLLCGEVFPLSVRGSALALATITNFASNFIVSLFIPELQTTLGQSGLYFAFAGVGVAALLTINAIVPETKGKSLEQIESMW
jgi:sugar porter (SP) family MFS transporter